MVKEVIDMGELFFLLLRVGYSLLQYLMKARRREQEQREFNKEIDDLTKTVKRNNKHFQTLIRKPKDEDHTEEKQQERLQRVNLNTVKLCQVLQQSNIEEAHNCYDALIEDSLPTILSYTDRVAAVQQIDNILKEAIGPMGFTITHENPSAPGKIVQQRVLPRAA